jgi:RhoGAP domain.
LKISQISHILYVSDTNTDINTLDIPVNAVATALKDFFSKKLPPLFTEEHMAELEDISSEYYDSFIRESTKLFKKLHLGKISYIQLCDF